MPDETSTPLANTQALPLNTEAGAGQASEPVTPPAAEPTPPPPEAAAPALEPESLSQSETETGKTPPMETAAQVEVSESVPEPTPEQQTQPEPVQSSSPARAEPQSSQSQNATTTIRPHGNLAAANAKIQATKRKRLDKIMTRLSEKGEITNDEVEKLLRVSDATATRYIQTLEKENRIKQTGKTGVAVFYEKI